MSGKQTRWAKFSGFYFKIMQIWGSNHEPYAFSFGICSRKIWAKLALTMCVGQSHCGFPTMTQFMHKTRNYRWGISWLISSDYMIRKSKIGDTPDEGETWYSRNPVLTRRFFPGGCVNKDAMKTKRWKKALKQLMVEGVPSSLLFDMATPGSRPTPPGFGGGPHSSWGLIQFRLKNAINATVEFQPMISTRACWIT